MTGTTANARSPSISLRYFIVCWCAPGLTGPGPRAASNYGSLIACKAFHVTRHLVNFQVELRPRRQRAEGGHFEGMRNQVHPKSRPVHFVDSQADAIDRNRSLARDEACQVGWRLDHDPRGTGIGCPGHDGAQAIDVS